MIVLHFQSIFESMAKIKKMRATIEREPRIDVRSTTGKILGLPASKGVQENVPTYIPSFALEDVTFA